MFPNIFGALKLCAVATLTFICCPFKLPRVRDFHGGLVGKVPCSQRRGPRFDPWSGTLIPHAAMKTQRSQINK